MLQKGGGGEGGELDGERGEEGQLEGGTTFPSQFP